MKLTGLLTLGVVLVLGLGPSLAKAVERPSGLDMTVSAEEVDPHPELPPKPEAPGPEDTEPTDPVPEDPNPEEPEDPEPPEELENPVPLNATQQDRIRRFSEASGVPEDEILQMRLKKTKGERFPVSDPEVPPPDGEGPKSHGWGVIAKWLGLHPGVSGKGTGDKFYPKDEQPPEDPDVGGQDPQLPEPPAPPQEAVQAVNGAREKVRKNLAKRKKPKTASAEIETSFNKQEMSRGQANKATRREVIARKTPSHKVRKPETRISRKPDKSRNPGKGRKK